jgi:CheY-like chemotaxis protein
MAVARNFETAEVSRRRVLLAEDDPELRRLIASVLRSDGYEVVEAADGLALLAHIEHALTARRERSDTFLVLADIQMPGLSGLDVLAILRCARCATPVVLMTGFGDDETHGEARELGAAALFDKPVDLDRLRNIVLETMPP